VYKAKAWSQAEATLFWHQTNGSLALFSGQRITYHLVSSHASTQVGLIGLAKALETFFPMEDERHETFA
jgi:hypothetical protein